ncbi:hypothetical protein ACH47B_18685 [Rhodococcus sp. NPDC019627]|uniref:hypothetical protein n=1 Tax=Rhodococcus TaxID=1827 RepID=UPI001357119A|nr:MULTISPECIES: hypothetical protein [Rhodococcus]MDV7356167.1 hypothetical protein [Rhodococcus oxybenzonivorans]QTJ64672.1 hypothetical protein HYG77_02990 [Rhodococcus sp. ZPP]
MKLRKITVAAVAIAAALTMSACGSDDSDTATKTTTTTTSAAETSEAIEVPTAAELNALLVKGLDPNTPLEEKSVMVEGSEQDPQLINQVAAAAKANNAEVTVLDPVIDNGDGTASGQLQLTVNGQVQQGGLPAIFIPGENGEWKLSKVTACQIVSLAQLTSPACPA